jgi:hypothetical protein
VKLAIGGSGAVAGFLLQLELCRSFSFLSFAALTRSSELCCWPFPLRSPILLSSGLALLQKPASLSQRTVFFLIVRHKSWHAFADEANGKANNQTFCT